MYLFFSTPGSYHRGFVTNNANKNIFELVDGIAVCICNEYIEPHSWILLMRYIRFIRAILAALYSVVVAKKNDIVNIKR